MGKHAKSDLLGELDYLRTILIHPHTFFLLLKDQWYNYFTQSRRFKKVQTNITKIFFSLRGRDYRDRYSQAIRPTNLSRGMNIEDWHRGMRRNSSKLNSGFRLRKERTIHPKTMLTESNMEGTLEIKWLWSSMNSRFSIARR